jgi:hypothetical protein
MSNSSVKGQQPIEIKMINPVFERFILELDEADRDCLPTTVLELSSASPIKLRRTEMFSDDFSNSSDKVNNSISQIYFICQKIKL